MTGEPRMTISAIVCAYNEANYLPACLHALLAQTRPPDEIIVIDNASTDGTGDLGRAVPGVRVIHEPARGLVVARETARVAARGSWVWTSARRYRAMGKGKVFGLYVRNFWSEILRHRPADRTHLDVRI